MVRRGQQAAAGGAAPRGHQPACQRLPRAAALFRPPGGAGMPLAQRDGAVPGRAGHHAGALRLGVLRGQGRGPGVLQQRGAPRRPAHPRLGAGLRRGGVQPGAFVRRRKRHCPAAVRGPGGGGQAAPAPGDGQLHPGGPPGGGGLPAGDGLAGAAAPRLRAAGACPAAGGVRRPGWKRRPARPPAGERPGPGHQGGH